MTDNLGSMDWAGTCPNLNPNCTVLAGFTRRKMVERSIRAELSGIRKELTGKIAELTGLGG
jgi:hypothetical protein